PAGVIRPIVPLPNVVNHTFPSGPAVMPRGYDKGGSGDSSIVVGGAGRIRAIFWGVNSVKQGLAAGAAPEGAGSDQWGGRGGGVMGSGWEEAVGTANSGGSGNIPPGVMRPI